MAKLKSATRNRLPSSVFGLPKQRKYPTEDRTHQIKAEEFATKTISSFPFTKRK